MKYVSLLLDNTHCAEEASKIIEMLHHGENTVVHEASATGS